MKGLIKKNEELINYINYKSIYGKSDGRKKLKYHICLYLVMDKHL